LMAYCAMILFAMKFQFSFLCPCALQNLHIVSVVGYRFRSWSCAVFLGDRHTVHQMSDVPASLAMKGSIVLGGVMIHSGSRTAGSFWFHVSIKWWTQLMAGANWGLRSRIKRLTVSQAL
jgi:hypothetical protein